MDKAEVVCRFISALKQTKGVYAGQKIELMPWQLKIITDIFGTLLPDGRRQYRTAYIEVPRKNGKSTLSAAIALALFFVDQEPGSEIYSAACDKDQASIVFNEAVGMIEQSSALIKACKIIRSTKRILKPDGSMYRVLSADVPTKHGLNAHGIIFDELHAQRSRDLWDVLTTSSGTRSQPLVVAITTAGHDRKSVCWEQHEYARRVLEGSVKDPTYYPVIFSSEPDKWREKQEWYKANPALGVYRSLEEFENQFKRAEKTPSYENTFKRLYLNIWTTTEKKWLSGGVWLKCKEKVDDNILEGKTCTAGIDLSYSRDFTAVVYVFNFQDYYYCLPRIFIPRATVEERGRNIGIENWVANGHVYECEGETIEYEAIYDTIKADAKRFYIKEIAYDRFGATPLVQRLQNDGFTMIEHGQSFIHMSPVTKEFEKLVYNQKIRADNDCLDWMVDNVYIHTDSAGNVKPNKGKSADKIDGVIALLMALDRAIRVESASCYENNDLLVV